MVVVRGEREVVNPSRSISSHDADHLAGARPEEFAGPSVAPTPSKATHTSPQKELRALRLPSTVAPTSPTLVVVAVLYPQLWLHPVVLCKCTDRTLSRGESGSGCQVMAISFTFIISCTFSIRQQYFSLIINQSTLI